MAGSFGQCSTWRNPFASEGRRWGGEASARKAVPGRDNAASFQTQAAAYFSSGRSGVQGVSQTENKCKKKCALPGLCLHGLISGAPGE